jgi:hypothetical protein
MTRIQQIVVMPAQLVIRVDRGLDESRAVAMHPAAPPNPIAPGIAPPSVRTGIMPHATANNQAQAGIGSEDFFFSSI